MFKTFKEFLKSKNISDDDYKAKSAEEIGQLHSEYFDAKVKNSEDASKSEREKLKAEIETLKTDAKKFIKADDFDKVKNNLDEALESIDALKENGGSGSGEKNSLSNVLAKNKADITSLATNKSGNLSFEVKASHGSSDITGRDAYAEVESGTNRKPFRRFNVAGLFRRLPMSKETLKYREENTVTRDGKVVIACAASTHTSKKSWIVRSLELAKVRDYTDICEDMMDDFDFVEGEIRELVEQGVDAKEEQELLSGAGDGTSGSYLSIETIASEFSHANALAPYTNAFESATLAELTDAMKAQIVTFGQENKWIPNVILMNFNDLVKFKHQKNADGNYLLPHFLSTNGNMLNDMQIVTSPLVAPDTLYVMDTMQAVIRDRKTTEVSMYHENGTNAEREMVMVKALKRSQLHVKHIDRDAFMKCTSISAALAAITKV